MSPDAMKVNLREFSEEGKVLEFHNPMLHSPSNSSLGPGKKVLNAVWLEDSARRVDEKAAREDLQKERSSFRPKGVIDPTLTGNRNMDATFVLRKVDEMYVIDGELDAPVFLLCSRCASSFQLDCHSKFSGLFSKDLAMVSSRPDSRTEGRMGAHQETDGFDSETDVEVVHLRSDSIDLGDMVTEQLQLRVPIKPLCREDCKGLCGNCGADLNEGRCACDRITTESPFSVLENLKIKGRKQ